MEALWQRTRSRKCAIEGTGTHMGILKAVTGAMKSVLDEQWREFFSCDAIGSDWLLVRGKKRIGPRSANTRVDDDVLTNGSILAVADGQCVLVVKQGKVIDVCAEPGEHIFEDPEQGGVKGFFREVGRRVCFGGGDIQPTVYRVYYLNVLEITGIPFETPAAIPLRVRDPVTGMDLDSSVRLSGCCSYRVSDPVKLYKTVIGNVRGNFSRREIDSHIRADLIKALQSALAACAAAGIRPSRLPAHVPDLCEALRELPLERILLETDAPFVKPLTGLEAQMSKKKLRTVRNTPLILPAVIERIAELKGLSPEEVERATSANARALFKL